MNKKNIIVVGGDGFCGWPTALHLSNRGHKITIIDNLSRRNIDTHMGTDSLPPISPIQDRLSVWKFVSGEKIEFANIDPVLEYERLADLFSRVRPDTIIQVDEQRGSTYSIKGAHEKRHTVDNNISATHTLLATVSVLGLDAHIVNLGTMGVYGYDGDGIELAEGFLRVQKPYGCNRMVEREILYPSKPSSAYRMTKATDHLLFQFYAENDSLRITDLHQGIVWGTHTAETMLDERLVKRLNCDGAYGTIVNRSSRQAGVGYPLAVPGTGGENRTCIHIQDTVECIALVVETPVERTGKVRCINQVTETLAVSDLANLIGEL